MLLAGFWSQAEEPRVAVDFDEFDHCFRIRQPFHNSLREPRRPGLDSGFDEPVLAARCAGKASDGEVLAFDGLLFKELVIAATRLGLDAEQDEASGFSVETMDGREAG